VKFLIAALMALLCLPAYAAMSSCQLRLLKVLGRLGPEDEVKTVGVPQIQSSPRSAEVVQHVMGEGSPNTITSKVKTSKGNEIAIRIVSPIQFLALQQRVKKKGFWVLFNPSPADQKLATGHLSLLIGDHVFNRFSDDLGPEAMRSYKLQEVGALLHSSKMPYVIAQFFELSEESLQILEKFYHDRVWNYHAGVEGWRTVYDRLPFDRIDKGEACENCSVFSWSFLDPSWRAVEPKLKKVQEEFGQAKINPIPALQLDNNTQVEPYRMTFLIGLEPQKIEADLMSSKFGTDTVEAQSFFHDFKK
jgi:hypothetical protein